MTKLLPLLILPALAMTAPALAQISMGSGGGAPIGAPSTRAQGQTGAKKEPPPPALPGARAEQPAVAPAERSAADLPPTEALFDAINRGDLATAKDALNRGADINGTNVLGLTPLDLAIDLGRNDISFLLLSLRGASGFSAQRGPAPATAVPAPQTRAERLAAARAEREAVRASDRERAVAARTAPGPAPQTPKLFAGGGGTPVPQAGFLGFDAGR